MRTLILILIFLFSIQLYSQESEEKEEKQIEENFFEIVVSGVYVYTPESGNFDPSIEALLTYWLSEKWGAGIGYSLVFEDHERVGNEILTVASHKPWEFLTVNFGPNFSLANSEKDFEVSAYLEGELNFDIGNIHFGPVLGTLIGEEFRIFGGFHLGFELWI